MTMVFSRGASPGERGLASRTSASWGMCIVHFEGPAAGRMVVQPPIAQIAGLGMAPSFPLVDDGCHGGAQHAQRARRPPASAPRDAHMAFVDLLQVLLYRGGGPAQPVEDE